MIFPVRTPLLISFLVLALSACGGGGDSKTTTQSPTKKTIAFNKIKSFAANSNKPEPTVKDYIAAGITGVNSKNLKKMNAVVSKLTPDDVDTKEELVSLTTQLQINIVPMVDAGTNKTIQLNQTTSITGNATDSDGSIASYSWKEGTTVLSTSKSFKYMATSVGNHTLTFSATDNDGGKASDSVIIRVMAAAVKNQIPTAKAGTDRTLQVNKSIVISGSGTDTDGKITHYKWMEGKKVLSNKASFSYKPVTQGKHILTLTVTDNKGASASDSLVITVTAKPVVADTVNPIIALIGSPNIKVIEGAPYNDAGATATDNVDGNITARIKVGGDVVNTNTPPGTTFVISYNVKDKAKNAAIEVTRTVTIIADPSGGHFIPKISEASKTNYLKAINAARSVARTCSGTGNFPAVPAVTWSDKLYKAAYEHSQDLGESNTFSHNGSGTLSDWTGHSQGKQSTFVERIADKGYSYFTISENISAGTNRGTAQKAIDSWLTSPGHCHNIMSASVTQVGMAHFQKAGSAYSHYWTQNFGKSQ